MSIQSTISLKRWEAEKMLNEKRKPVCEMTNEEIENELESQFYNYQVYD